MNAFATIAPRRAVGGQWDEVGRAQLEFLSANGLAPHHRLLDIGCGCLRGGRHFIRYLDAGHYWGLDSSHAMIRAGRRLLLDGGLESRSPTLLVSRDLRFRELQDARFDYALAHSVFTHTTEAVIDECLRHIGSVLSDRGAFFASYLDGGDATFRRGPLRTIVFHPRALFRRLGDRYGLHVETVDSFPHRRREHLMLRFTHHPRATGEGP